MEKRKRLKIWGLDESDILAVIPLPRDVLDLTYDKVRLLFYVTQYLSENEAGIRMRADRSEVFQESKYLANQLSPVAEMDLIRLLGLHVDSPDEHFLSICGRGIDVFRLFDILRWIVAYLGEVIVQGIDESQESVLDRH